MRAHHGKARIDHAALTFFDLVHGRFHIVVDAASGNTTQRREGPGVRVKQHLVALAWVGHQPERATGAQLHVRDLHLVVNASHHHAFIAPVKLEGLTQLKLQRHKGVG